ncbi:hypothetical protein [Crateriforma spongiae]|uniref:hypothetical protein n=1 Tax=Crateriforma spongiae TaxID=2724528 RepID=UPI0039B0F7B7
MTDIEEEQTDAHDEKPDRMAVAIKNAGTGLPIGVAVGAGIGVAMDNLPIGIAIGIPLGMILTFVATLLFHKS